MHPCCLVLPALAFGAVPATEIVLLPMSDGVRLETRIYLPETGGPAWPVFFERRPYPFQPQEEVWTPYGYAVVDQSVRGRNASEGDFKLFGRAAVRVDLSRAGDCLHHRLERISCWEDTFRGKPLLGLKQASVDTTAMLRANQSLHEISNITDTSVVLCTRKSRFMCKTTTPRSSPPYPSQASPGELGPGS